MAARPPAITAMPRPMASGVPSRAAHFAATPVKFSATIIRASGAVRSPASSGS